MPCRHAAALALAVLLPVAPALPEVVTVVASSCTCAALLSDGHAATWRARECDGDSAGFDSSWADVRGPVRATSEFLAQRNSIHAETSWPGEDVLTELEAGVTKIVASEYHFAALKSDGSVVTWTSRPCTACRVAPSQELASSVVDIAASGQALAALKADGSVLSWGKRCCGAELPEESSALAGVVSLHGAADGFAARRADGSVVTWGGPAKSAEIASFLEGGVSKVISHPQFSSFVALKHDGRAALWGPGAGEFFSSVESAAADAFAVVLQLTDGTAHSRKDDSRRSTIDPATACQLVGGEIPSHIRALQETNASTTASSTSSSTITFSSSTTTTGTASSSTSSGSTTSSTTGTSSTQTATSSTSSTATSSVSSTTSSSATLTSTTSSTTRTGTTSTSSSVTHTTSTQTTTSITRTTSTKTTSTRTFTTITRTTSTATTVTTSSSTATTVTTSSSTRTTTSFTSSSSSTTSTSSSSTTSSTTTSTSFTTSSTTKTVTTSTSSSATSSSTTSTSQTTSSTTQTRTTSTSSSATSTSSSSTTSTFSSSSVTRTTSTSSSATSSSSTSSSTTQTFTTSTSSSATSTSSTTSSTTKTFTTSTSSSKTSTSSTSTSTTTTSTSATSTSTSSTSTTFTSSSSTTSTTTLQEKVVMPSTLTNTTQGKVLFQSLEAALSLASQETNPMLQADTESGRVTAVKMAPAQDETPTVLTLTRSSEPGTISVVVPQGLLRNLSEGGNTILVMTEVTAEVTRGIPTEGTAPGDKVVLHSPVVDFSFVNEVSGTLRLLDVSGSERIAFTITNRPPVKGERCSFFDPQLNAWSDAGMELVEYPLSDPSASASNASWCVTNHTSLFALVESLPLDLLIESESNPLNESTYTAAIGITGGMLCILCVMCSPWMRRIRAPTSGHVRLVNQRGQVHQVAFKCSIMDAQPEEEEVVAAKTLTRSLSGGSPMRKAPTKVLVKWDLAGEMLEDLGDQDYSRKSVKTDVSWMDQRQVVRTKTGDSAVSRQSSERKDTLRRLAETKSHFNLEEDGMEEADATLPGWEDPLYEDYDIDADEPTLAVDLDAYFRTGLQEAYANAEEVMYFSTSQRAYIPARVEGPGLHDADNVDALPRYNLLVGVRKQRRTLVPMCALRHPLSKGAHVKFYSTRKHTWLNALVLQTPALHLSAHVSKYHILLEEDEEPGKGRRRDVPLQLLQRRYMKGEEVEVFLNREEGWVPAVVGEETFETTPTPPEEPDETTAGGDRTDVLKREGSMASMASQLLSVEAALADQSTMVRVFIRDKSSLAVPSFQLRPTMFTAVV